MAARLPAVQARLGTLIESRREAVTYGPRGAYSQGSIGPSGRYRGLSVNRDLHSKVLPAPAANGVEVLRRVGVSSKISGIDGTQVAAVGAGRPVQRPQGRRKRWPELRFRKRGLRERPDHGHRTAARLISNRTSVDLPAVNEQRVAQLRTAIEQGTYQVRPQHIADQLMSLERALNQLPDAEDRPP